MFLISSRNTGESIVAEAEGQRGSNEEDREAMVGPDVWGIVGNIKNLAFALKWGDIYFICRVLRRRVI